MSSRYRLYPMIFLLGFYSTAVTARIVKVPKVKRPPEGYFNGYERESIVTSFSVTKSFVSTLVGIAIDEGLIGSVNDAVTRYIPELKERDPRFSYVTIKDLLLMSSGFKFREGPPDWDNGTIYFHPDLRRDIILMDIFSALKEGIINTIGGEKSEKMAKMISLQKDIGDS